MNDLFAALLGGLCLGIGIERGVLNSDTPFFPAWAYVGLGLGLVVCLLALRVIQ
jgi:hypothetical protein